MEPAATPEAPLFSLVTEYPESKPGKSDVKDTDAVAEWEDPLQDFRVKLELAVPIVVGILGLILILLIFGVKALRQCKLAWQLVSLIVAVYIKSVVLMPMEWTSHVWREGWTYGAHGCKAYHFFNYMQKSLIPFVLVWICADRLWFCYRPDVYAARMNWLLGGAVVAVPWCLALTMAAILNFNWGAPKLFLTSHGGDGIFAGGDTEVFNVTICHEANSEMLRERTVDIVLYAVPCVLCILLVVSSFGSCCARRRMFYESRAPLVHALLFVVVLVVLFTGRTFVALYRLFNELQVNQLLHASKVLGMLRLIDISEKVFYLMVPLVLLVLVQDIRDGIGILCRNCCSRKGPNEKSRLI